MTLLSKYDYNSVAKSVGVTLRSTRRTRWLSAAPDPAAQPTPPPAPVRPRPGTVLDMVGQEDVRVTLLTALRSAVLRSAPAPHCLLSGPAGVGKTTMGRVVSTYMGTNLVETTPSALDSPRALAAVLLGLQTGDVLFIDEIHELRRRRGVLDCLDIAMEDGQITVPASGRSGTASTQALAPFTVVGATTNPGELPAPLLRRFGFRAMLDYYSIEELAEILTKAAVVEGITITPEAAALLAQRAKGTPANAINLLRNARDLAVSVTQAATGAAVDAELAAAAMDQHHIDSLGLDASDRLVLHTLCVELGGGPVGVTSLAATSGVDAPAIRNLIEPYLVKAGLVRLRGTQGRVATAKAYEHLGLPMPVEARMR